MKSSNIQLDANGRLKHFLSVEGLDKVLLEQILLTAESFVGVLESAADTGPVTMREGSIVLEKKVRVLEDLLRQFLPEAEATETVSSTKPAPAPEPRLSLLPNGSRLTCSA